LGTRSVCDYIIIIGIMHWHF